ncbi:exopolysaccharide biosynthesis polyprenyl glycosylphosphotransferase [Zavarzinia sp. CC-PAN008]|uniref:exopolysaccharide biosynthesis polyprenyl glycosylphosphotransferase n=1 Tax=Zavarzinia sp. CC-PAN008 TaxID=3243332 RepID=UPI003F7446A4
MSIDGRSFAMTSSTVPQSSPNKTPYRKSAPLSKEVFDRTCAFVALLLLLPVLILVGIAIKITSPGPIMFKQKRAGLNNEVFWIYKFRTMYTDKLDHGGRNQTQRNDPRVTPLGAFLRRTSIDELPQVLNVLRGEMSLVGPRPHPLEMSIQGKATHDLVENYGDRHAMKPGITGWAQVNGLRGACDEPDQLTNRVKADLYYIRNWSFLLDIKIILKTVLIVFRRDGAY